MASLLRMSAFVLYGNSRFTRQAYERASRSFDNSCMERSLTGRICIVTGANAGLGLKCSQELARRGATIYMICRNEERGRAAAERVRTESGNADVHLEVCDISSLESIAAFAASWHATGRPCHLLVNNAGVLLNERATTVEGFEASFATNVLGTAALTARMLPALVAGAPARVITVTSGGLYSAAGLQLEQLRQQQGQLRQPDGVQWDGAAAYSRDKRRQLALTEHWAATVGSQSGVSFYAMHPGWADTEGVRTSIPGFHKAFQAKLRDTAQGVDTILWLALEDEARLTPGALYLDRATQPKALPLTGTGHTPAQAAALHDTLMGLAGLPVSSGG